MTATLAIPEIGEMGSADRVPAKVQWAHITAGSATTNDIVLGDTGIYTLLNIDFTTDESLVIKRIYTQVETAFTANVNISIGDTGTVELFCATTTVAATATGAVLVPDTACGTVPYVYSAAQDLILDLEAATVAAGKLHIYVEYVLLSD